MTHQLCNAVQPDDVTRRCIRYLNHPGPHQTFVAEWNDGDTASRRRPRPALPPQATESRRNKPHHQKRRDGHRSGPKAQRGKGARP